MDSNFDKTSITYDMTSGRTGVCEEKLLSKASSKLIGSVWSLRSLCHLTVIISGCWPWLCVAAVWRGPATTVSVWFVQLLSFYKPQASSFSTWPCGFWLGISKYSCLPCSCVRVRVPLCQLYPSAGTACDNSLWAYHVSWHPRDIWIMISVPLCLSACSSGDKPNPSSAGQAVDQTN